MTNMTFGDHERIVDEILTLKLERNLNVLSGQMSKAVSSQYIDLMHDPVERFNKLIQDQVFADFRE